jgi:hypothetical protein
MPWGKRRQSSALSQADGSPRQAHTCSGRGVEWQGRGKGPEGEQVGQGAGTFTQALSASPEGVHEGAVLAAEGDLCLCIGGREQGGVPSEGRRETVARSVANGILGDLVLAMMALRTRSAEDVCEYLSEPGLVIGVKGAEVADDQAGLNGGEQGLDDGRLEQASGLPAHDGDLANGGRGSDLAGDGHQDQVGALALVSLGADDDRGALLGGDLIREGKRNDDDVSESVGHGAGHFQMSL